MLSKIKTGDVFQIRNNGRNYVALGKAENREGDKFVVATLNGNINPNGCMKIRTGRGKGKVRLFKDTNIKRVHAQRTVDVASVGAVHPRLRNKIKPTNRKTGVVTKAANLLEQYKDIQSGLILR
jgi:predicted dinucleotide-utilizing enzyme